MHPLKKLGLLFVLLALLAGAIPAQGESVTGYAAENTVNLYGKNSASASVVATVSYGESLPAWRPKTAGYWWNTATRNTPIAGRPT